MFDFGLRRLSAAIAPVKKKRRGLMDEFRGIKGF